MPPSPTIRGPLAALLTPRTDKDRVDLAAAERLTTFLLDRGLTGVVVGGGTGDYAGLSVAERQELLETIATACRRRGVLVCSVGAARLEQSLAVAEHALRAGADALLAPPPHFYRYEQVDVAAYFGELTARAPAPTLLYNLAAFMTPIEPKTALRLLEDSPTLIGVKDSSGRLDLLEALTERPELGKTRILGHDARLGEALERGLIDAVISGPAGVVPELARALFDSTAGGDRERFGAARALLDEAVERWDALPYPWGLLLAAEQRGLLTARPPFSWPSGRLPVIEELRRWFPLWLERVEALK